MRKGWTYILTNKHHTVLYTGITNNIMRRVWEHRTKYNPQCFSSKYKLSKLIYVEECDSIQDAIVWEKKIKGKSRKNKIVLIERRNPQWIDLADGWF